MARTQIAPLLIVGAMLVGCSPSAPPAPGSSAPEPAPSSSASAPTSSSAATETSPAASEPATAPDGRPFVVTEHGTFDEPWALAFLPGTEWLAITERSGELWLRDDAGLVEVTGLPEVHDAGQGGLGDIVPSPDFASDHQIYLSWSEPGDGGAGTAVGRATLEISDRSAALVDLEVLWRQTPKVTGDGHFSQRIAFSPDGQYLFISSGDRQKMDPAQDLGVTMGKIIRLNLDGSPAAGNPFADRGGVSAEIYSFGHRNPLGLAFDPVGNLWSSEMGPQGGDELNLIIAGANYGWPLASNGSHYGGGEIPDHVAGDGFEAPKVWWNPSISPGSLLIYDGEMFPDWRGDAFIGALSGQALLRIDLDGTNAGEAERWDWGARVRGLAQAPDGSIWLIEDAGAGRLLQLIAP